MMKTGEMDSVLKKDVNNNSLLQKKNVSKAGNASELKQQN